MKKKFLIILAGLMLIGGAAFADVASLNPDTGHQAYLFQYWNCTVSGGVPVPGTCSAYYVNWSNLVTYLAANVNWVDLTGTTVTGVVSNATFLKGSAP